MSSQRSLTCTLTLAMFTPLVAQIHVDEAGPAQGHGHYQHALTECITDAERVTIQQHIETSRALLQAQGLLSVATHAPTPLFAWPLRAGAGLSDPGYHGISNYVDHNPNTGQLQDYTCGARTYDSGTYDHAGTDIYTWPWSWYKMDFAQVEIIAASPGTIVFKQDGNFDRSCATAGGNWNAVYVQHNDGSVAWYGHMKSGSLTPKAVGQTVAQGEYLGVVGSSGNSTGPHLHLEVYDAGNQLIDPWAGACNATTPTSWWAAQRPYFDPAVNALRTHFADVNWGSCPAQEVLNTRDSYCASATIRFAAYYRDQLNGQVSTSVVRRPDQSVFQTWTTTSPQYYSSSWWWNAYNLPSNPPTGKWSYAVTLNGVTNTHYFYVGTQTPAITPQGPTTLCNGGSVPLTVPRMPGHTYQWSRNGTPIPSATDTIVQASLSGTYTCAATSFCSTITSAGVSVTNAPLLVRPKMFLEGAYSAGSMGDQLRVAGLVPVTEPYTALGYVHVGSGSGTTTPSVLATTGNDAIVDWVVVELRSAGDPTVRSATRAALVQRDGDVVDTDGISAVAFSVACGNYYVAVRHRNHLGVMTAAAITLGTTAAVVDFTLAATAVYGTNARKDVSGTQVLWAGDVTFNGQLKYAGGANDRDPILTAIGGTVPTNTLSGQYRQEDINLNGQVKYAGSANDRDILLQNSGGSVPTAVRNAQLP
ncbi:MAG: peptidoglycan DD-metalloendopeptidase family protein [Flavobacteriales bacterium]|nr:peptidoglycan DD-metalloendopeptidase family protein [Flavobacteriales bacterium]